ncbi:MAG TPA: FdhF/YdeP family oxidoreductase [Acidimicrobiia bacterium]
MRRPKAGGGIPAIVYSLRAARRAGGLRATYRALRSRNVCKTCALGMGGQRGGMVNETGHFPEVCKKSIQAMTADMSGAIPDEFFDTFELEALARLSPRDLEAAGRITKPMYAGPLDRRYRPISWDEALQRITGKLNAIDPGEAFFYMSGRSSNEAAFLLQVLARVYGTNNVNNCSYYCHQASGVALSSVTGSGTATVVLDDLEGLGRDDVLFIIGANPASNHPRLMSIVHRIKRRGARVVIINPLKETGLVRFRVPSIPSSLLFGTKVADEYLQPHIGGDIALLTGLAKRVLENEAANLDFCVTCADGWDEFAAHVRATTWETIEAGSGVPRADIQRVGDLYCRAPNAIFAWAMGITHHTHGVDNVRAIANLAMMRGMLGRPQAGLLPIRGHSNVQGVGSMGVTPKLKKAVFEHLERELGVTDPGDEGLDTMGCMVGAAEGRLKVGICLGGNLYGSNPDAAFAAKALRALDLVVYMSTTLNTGHASGRGQETIILPVLPRDEEPQPTTQESMFNFVRMSDGGPPRHEGPRSEVAIIADIGETVDKRRIIDWAAFREHRNIRKAIARTMPGFEAMERIDTERKEFQIVGRTFHEPQFATESSRARFHVVPIPPLRGGNGHLRLMTIRSEGQFNTVVYEVEDRYRGQERRDVIMMSPADIERLGLAVDVPVKVVGEAGTMERVLVRAIDIPPGNCVMYYPEANMLLPKTVDPESRTPAFKNGLVSIVATGSKWGPSTPAHLTAR